MSAAAATARSRLLHRTVSPAQRQATRRNGAKSRGPHTPAGIAHSSRNARQHGFYAKLHLFTPEETEALRDETQYFIESFRPAGPLALALVRQIALATFQMRRITQVEVDFQVHNPRDFLAIARLFHALGAIETRYELLCYRCLRRLERLATKNEANEPGNLLKQNVEPASAGVYIHHFFPSPASAKAPARHGGAGFSRRRSGLPGRSDSDALPGHPRNLRPSSMSRTPRSLAALSSSDHASTMKRRP